MKMQARGLQAPVQRQRVDVDTIIDLGSSDDAC